MGSTRILPGQRRFDPAIELSVVDDDICRMVAIKSQRSQHAAVLSSEQFVAEDAALAVGVDLRLRDRGAAGADGLRLPNMPCLSKLRAENCARKFKKA
jgi:hypothetical protein